MHAIGRRRGPHQLVNGAVVVVRKGRKAAVRKNQETDTRLVWVDDGNGKAIPQAHMLTPAITQIPFVHTGFFYDLPVGGCGGVSV